MKDKTPVLTPQQLAQDYKDGTVSTSALVEALAHWDYAPNGQTDGYDSLIVDPPGTFDELVGSLFDNGVIDGDTYDAILDRMEELDQTQQN